MAFSHCMRALILLTVLSACGPIYDTRYNFTPPNEPTGRVCTYQCENSRSSCLQMQAQMKQNCEMQNRTYEQMCETNIRLGGREPKWYECSGQSCNDNSEMCESQYRSCYQACGGKVDSQQVCVMNCGGA